MYRNVYDVFTMYRNIYNVFTMYRNIYDVFTIDEPSIYVLFNLYRVATPLEKPVKSGNLNCFDLCIMKGVFRKNAFEIIIIIIIKFIFTLNNVKYSTYNL